MSESFEKLIRIERDANGKVRAYVGDKQLWFVSYHEDYGRNGHTITLTIPAEHISFEHER